VVLTAVVLRGVLNLWRAAGAPIPDPVRRRPWRVATRFVALTAVNPLTAVYFVALAAGSAASIHGARLAAAFVAGVFLASAAWQLLLATIGALAGARLGERARVATGLLGYLVVLGYAVRLAAGAG
jgi:arginine exporter protein ArgO